MCFRSRNPPATAALKARIARSAIELWPSPGGYRRLGHQRSAHLAEQTGQIVQSGSARLRNTFLEGEGFSERPQGLGRAAGLSLQLTDVDVTKRQVAPKFSDRGVGTGERLIDRNARSNDLIDCAGRPPSRSR